MTHSRPLRPQLPSNRKREMGTSRLHIPVGHCQPGRCRRPKEAVREGEPTRACRLRWQQQAIRARRRQEPQWTWKAQHGREDALSSVCLPKGIAALVNLEQSTARTELRIRNRLSVYRSVLGTCIVSRLPFWYNRLRKALIHIFLESYRIASRLMRIRYSASRYCSLVGIDVVSNTSPHRHDGWWRLQI